MLIREIVYRKLLTSQAQHEAGRETNLLLSKEEVCIFEKLKINLLLARATQNKRGPTCHAAAKLFLSTRV